MLVGHCIVRTFVLSKIAFDLFDRGRPLNPRWSTNLSPSFEKKNSNPMTHLATFRALRTATVLAVLLFFAPKLFSQCNPDVTPPTAACDEFTQVALGPTGQAEVFAATFDDGSYDDCCQQLTFSVKRLADGPCDGDAQPDAYGPSIILCCADINAEFTVSLRVTDCAGNTNDCLISVLAEDKIDPVLQAPADVTVTCEQFDPTLASYGTATATDNCCMDTVVFTANYSQFDTLCSKGTITRTFIAFDCSGNSSTLGVVSAVQKIYVNHVQSYNLRFPDDVITNFQSPTGFYGEPSFNNVECELIGVSYADVVFTNEPDCDYKVERTWTVINWCTYDPNLGAITIPNPNPNSTINHPANMPGPIVSAPGTQAPWASSIVKVNASDPSPTDYSTFWQANANRYDYTQTIKIIDTFFVAVQGQVFSDTTSNCSYDNGEEYLESWTVRATGQITGNILETQTDASGSYAFNLSGFDTTVVITLVASSNFGLNCQSEYTLNIAVGETATQDIPVHLEQRCGLLSVDLTTNRLRRCAANNSYTVQACNLSGETVENAWVEVALDDFFTYENSSIPGTLVSGNTYSFQLGDLEPGACAKFYVTFGISCDAQLGASHCTEAFVYPYDDCRTNANWSGAEVKVDAVCEGDSVKFSITNIGDASMSENLEFVVVEDVVMRQEGTFQLDLGETFSFKQEANGSTWRLEADQEPLHPWGGRQAVALEGCGGINQTGLVNMFPLNDANPFQALECRENVGSYDPNDKQAFPAGYGNQHFIKPNTDIEYLIRFQNTGTDTAFKVVILDTLSQYLDVNTVRPGVASHNMEFAVIDGNVLRFTFDNIYLPDSNVNWAASNGFVKFRIAQKPDLADGILLENSAAIYFDNNEPVITNTSWHTVGREFVTVSVDDPAAETQVKAYPNPAVEGVVFDLKTWTNNGAFILVNNLGQVVNTQTFTGNQFRFDRKQLPAGIYSFQILSENAKTASGKIVLR